MFIGHFGLSFAAKKAAPKVSLAILFIAIFLIGTYIYATFTKAKNKIGKWMLRTLIILLLAVQLANTFGPTPSSSIITLFISFITLMVIILALAYWVDKNRELTK